MRSLANLAFTTITVKGRKTGVQTNVDGLFTIQKVPSDTSALVISYIGYRTLTYYLNPQTPTSNLRIDLVPANEELDEVKVTGEKPKS
jgi:hypothetical protein